MMAVVLHLWNEWEVQILVLVSYTLQVTLLIFAWMRRRRISRWPRILLWLVYLLADSTATYTLGHMSISYKPSVHRRLMAFWAPFLLVHLGGQDTITAYAMEDNQLWLRHLLTLVVQALGAAYVLYKYMAGSETLIMAAAILMFAVGVIKYAERIWALKSSNLDNISKFLDGVRFKQKFTAYSASKQSAEVVVQGAEKQGLAEVVLQHAGEERLGADVVLPGVEVDRSGDEAIPHVAKKEGSGDEVVPQHVEDKGLDAEVVRQDGEVEQSGDEVVPQSGDEKDLQGSEEEDLDSEVVLQGAHDLLHICMGQFVDYKVWPSKFQCDTIKFFNSKGSMFVLIEMQLSLMYDIFYTKAPVIDTWWGCYIRVFSLLGTAMSFFFFQFSSGKDNYNEVDVIVTYTLLVGASLLEMVSALRAMASTWTCATLKATRWNRLNGLLVSLRQRVKVAERNRKWLSSIGQRNLVGSVSVDTISSGSCKVSKTTKKLVLEEINRMVRACEGKEDVLTTYRGQCVLKPLVGFLGDLNWSTRFDDSVLTWHHATDIYLLLSVQARLKNAGPLVEATKTLSNYMMFLLVEHPYMLPGRVRPRLFDDAKEQLLEQSGEYMQQMHKRIKKGDYKDLPPALVPGVTLATKLLNKERDMPAVLQVVFGVWVEMLCYAAHNCSRDSHARQLNNGGEFITVMWLLVTAAFNHRYCDTNWFEEETKRFFRPSTRPSRYFVFRRSRVIDMHRPRVVWVARKH